MMDSDIKKNWILKNDYKRLSCYDIELVMHTNSSSGVARKFGVS